MALTDNIVAYWKLDESSGNCSDSVGSSTGTNSNVTYSTGKIGNGASFNGSSAQFDFGNNLGTVFTSAFSINMRINVTDYNNYNGLLTKSRVDGQAGPMDCYIFQTTGKVYLYLGNGSGPTSFSTTAAIGTGTWTMLTLTWNGVDASGIKIYFNASLQAGTATAGAAPVNGTTSLLLGSRNDGVTRMKGMIDEVGVWSRELSSTEVTALYNSGAGLQYPFTSTFTPRITFF